MNPFFMFEAVASRLAFLAPMILRIGVGWVFLRHGLGKWQGGLAGVAGFFGGLGIPFPTAAAAVVITVETVGAACVLAGLLTRFWAACMVIEMSVAILTASLPSHKGFELEGLLLTGALALVTLGGGPLSVDRILLNKK